MFNRTEKRDFRMKAARKRSRENILYKLLKVVTPNANNDERTTN